MVAKQLLPNQCMPLHFIYGRNDCCLCKERERANELEARVKKLLSELYGTEEVTDGDSKEMD